MSREEFESASKVRCPFCLSQEPVWDCDGIYEVEDQRTYDMMCGGCGKSYDVTVVVDYTFHSPAAVERDPSDPCCPKCGSSAEWVDCPSHDGSGKK